MKNCYKQHGREDLLYAFEDQQTQQQTTTTHSIAHLVPSQTVVQTFSNPDGTVSLIQVSEILISSALHWALSSSSLSAWNWRAHQWVQCFQMWPPRGRAEGRRTSLSCWPRSVQ